MYRIESTLRVANSLTAEDKYNEVNCHSDISPISEIMSDTISDGGR